REVPAESERSVASAGVVGKRELRPKAGAARRCGDWHGHRTSAGHGVGGEFLADAADSAAAFGQRDCWRSSSRALRLTASFRTRFSLTASQHTVRATLTVNSQEIRGRV